MHRAIEEALISLPIRLGGLGILSYAKCAPHAYAAANELADTVFAPILPSIQPTSEPMLSQSKRCQDMFEAAHSSTFELLDSHKQVIVLESSSSLGRKWMNVLPTAAQFRLTDSEVAGALQQRTLRIGNVEHCRRCARERHLGHDEVCQGGGWMIPRHEQVKYALAHALRSVDGSLVTVGPHIQGTMRRNDIRFVAPPDVPLPRFDVDIKVISLSALDALHHPTPPHPPTDPIERRQFTIDDLPQDQGKTRCRSSTRQ